ncbi:MAG: hypothetical protein A2X61_00780 [Ignavibacteria bacterium GWB2_35_12]|nr:MAG: hypothetical protein A2X61_00780 [Ignavibacteria bacterium GWB2_35_12]OGU87536.1 MAG: hypothetical protein A2220_15540 [Ignavibacteria bacterium RIFOXYA2_FULL_35_10]OGV21727.1 MAG: hypothetical protein A2475_04005 [Ignavibacteria bacterium RIFOXYC2_FULL_35_21]
MESGKIGIFFIVSISIFFRFIFPDNLGDNMDSIQENIFEQTFSLSLIKEQLKPLIYHQNKTVRSYQQFFRLYYFIRLLKYTTQSQLRSLSFSGVSKVATKDILDELVNIRHISAIEKDRKIYIANETTEKILKAVSFNQDNYFKVFTPLPKGTDTANETKNSEVFIQSLKLPNYYFLLFPDFTYIRPDALLVLKEGKKYKLKFLEIETEQSNWEQRLDKMRNNYLKLKTDMAVFEYWKKMARFLLLPEPNIFDFKFSVLIIGSINKNWGKGFEFRERLY